MLKLLCHTVTYVKGQLAERRAEYEVTLTSSDDYYANTDPVICWLLDLRKLTWRERWTVGWRMWQDGVARFPWIMSQTTPESYES